MELVSLSHQAEQQENTLVKKMPFEKSRAMKPVLSTRTPPRARPSLGHHPAHLVAEIPAPGRALDVCATQGHQLSPTLGSLASDHQQCCELLAISCSFRISEAPKGGKSPSGPSLESGKMLECNLPY